MTAPLAPLDHLPSDVVALTDYETRSRAHMTEQAWAYITGGAADEITVRRNRTAFEQLELRTRVLTDLSNGDTGITLLGQSLAYPILLAPVAYQRLVHPEGERATAAAAGAMQAGMILSTQSSTTLEEVATQTDAPLWFQLYMQPDRGFTRALVERAQHAGYRALVVTVDAPVSGIRNREQRANFRLPEDVEAVNLRGMTSPESTSHAAPRTLADPPVFGTLLATTAPTWHDLTWLLSITTLPILVKGVTMEEDAERMIQTGVAGLIVSNHGGRTLDTVVPSIALLPRIADRVAHRVPILLDGGIRRGTDVLKALALGAQAVLIGRPYIHALATAGALGVVHVLAMLRAELEVAMALTGCAHITDICAELVCTHGGPSLQ